MTPDNVIQLIQNHESDSVEYTTATKDIDKFSKTICAFSNDFPSHKKSGYLLIGIQNRDGNRCGLTVTDELLKDLSSIHDNGGIQPLPSLIIQKVSFPDGDVAIVEVKPSPMPPVRYKGQERIRVGPT